jgi:5-methylcytosine-specific restriction endonuclease McrA
VLCGERPSTIADHKLSRAFGGSDDDDNLQGICATCDGEKSSAEGQLGRSLKR